MSSSVWEVPPNTHDEEDNSPPAGEWLAEDAKSGAALRQRLHSGGWGGKGWGAVPLGEAEFENGEEFEKYRQAYRNFRMGHYRGARGEKPEKAQEQTVIIDDLLDLDDDTMEPVYALLQDFRVAYRRHRQGGATGAKGEITDVAKRLTRKQVRLLPTAQQGAMKKALQQWEDTRSQRTADALDSTSLHLHAGAGRLGLGLVLPAIVETKRPFAIVQRNSDAWSNLSGATEVPVRLNGTELVKLGVVRTPQEATEAVKEGKKSLLVLSEDPDVLKPLVTAAETFSCSMGGKDLSGPLEPLFRAVKANPKGTRRPLYCCENDHDAVGKLADIIGEQLEPVPVLVDRVCTGREVNKDGSIDVTAEPYAGDMVIPPPLQAQPRKGQKPFAGPTVRQPQTQEGAEFLHRRKILTVNGTHTTLAFLTLIEEEPKTVGPPLASHELLAFDVDEASVEGADQSSAGRICYVWAVARQLMLLDEFTEDVLAWTLGGGEEKLDHHGICAALLQGAKAALRRLSQGGDQTSRVLGGGVQTRWQGRLNNVAEWLRVQRSWTPLARKLIELSGVKPLELRRSINDLVLSSKRFTEAPRKREQSRSLSPVRRRKAGAVLFDFDGTLGDTEQPAMEVAFWMLAPYLPGLEKKDDLAAECQTYVRENAGKAFEHMVEACDKDREAVGLKGVEATRAAREEPEALLAAVDRQRQELGLLPISELRQTGKEPPTLLQQQKEDTVTRLSVAARPCDGVVEALQGLQAMGADFLIATTSGKPRVPVCVDTAGLRRYFKSDDQHIHSGESDFQPPRFKPEPDVYLRAASYVRRPAPCCIAVEDSASGVGSASNACIGMIVGYVGASHIAAEKKESHARMLMQGTRAKNGRGADIVIEDMRDLPALVRYFANLVVLGKAGDGTTQLPLRADDLPALKGRAFFRDSGVAVLFDFDGTLGDTESPAMEVAYWMLAPYLPGLEGKDDAALVAECPVFVRENAGKAFEHMIEACDQQRAAASLPGVEATRAARGEPAALLAAVDRRRVALGLKAIAELRSSGQEPATLLQQQKDDTVVRLSVAARPCPGVPESLDALRGQGTSFVIATTSGKPRVPVCVDCAKLRQYFPSDELHIHSGESDFEPPRFKPAPDVYLRAASYASQLPARCVAVEDSASGVGSASNAGMGMIVGYVGASHIAPEQKESHAKMLMKGAKADNGRGADIVIEDMRDLPSLVALFATSLKPPLKAELPVLQGKVFTREDHLSA